MIVERPITRRVSAEDLLGIVQLGGPLLSGRTLRCPGCENVADILEYIPLEYSERYAEQVIVPLKCRRCRHVFALRP